ncbi:MAG: ClpXP protease specificity-enhancing factor SspB [Pseudomonadota bacterium]
MTRMIDYGGLMHRAMRSLIQEVLGDVAANGLPGEHHFLITFDTQYDGVGMADWLRERYPDEMMIVLQNWFEGLDVTDEGFGVTLNFGDQPERLEIPYRSILTFVDPFVEFGLRFETTDDDPPQDDPTGPDDAPDTVEDAEIVSLDKFRK